MTARFVVSQEQVLYLAWPSENRPNLLRENSSFPKQLEEILIEAASNRSQKTVAVRVKSRAGQ
jgi:hypothetical protein